MNTTKQLTTKLFIALIIALSSTLIFGAYHANAFTKAPCTWKGKGYKIICTSNGYTKLKTKGSIYLSQGRGASTYVWTKGTDGKFRWYYVICTNTKANPASYCRFG